MPDTLAQKVRAKFPGVYDDMSDAQLEQAVTAKYPGVYDDVPRTPDFKTNNEKDAEGNPLVSDWRTAMGSPDALEGMVAPFKGAAKAALNTAVGFGELVHRFPGVSAGVDAIYGTPGVSQASFADARQALTPKNAGEQLGATVEQTGEFFLPVGAAGKLRTAAEIAKAGALTLAQGGSGGEAAANTALTALVPGSGAVVKGAKALQESAHPLVRAAIKPTVTALRRISGGGSLDAKAQALVQFIVDNRLTTASKARSLFMNAETELKNVLLKANAKTDAATRADRYLTALERSAAKQGLPAEDIAQIRNAAAQLLDGPMGEDVVTMVSKPHPTLVNASGQPIQVLVPQTTRALRAAVPADEALESARASSRWSTNKQWGEQKGTATEAQKAVERGQRDAVKQAVPETRAILQTESKALQAENVLDRMAQRAGNRDTVSLPAHVIAAGEIAKGHVPLLAFAANWLRNNQLKAGIWADQLGKAIERGEAPKVADILKRLGVAGASQLMRTSEATP